jgi:hypothetical protein
MEASQPAVFTFIYVLWGFITVILVALLSYRATLLGEDGRIFSEVTTQDHHQQEMALIARRSRLTGEIIVLSVMSGVLLLTCVGISI